MREETHSHHHMGYFPIILLDAPSHRQYSTAFVTPVVEDWLKGELPESIIN